jgi:hypothetical protein
MDLSPLEFEALIQNLFVKMGLEARQTRAPRDGGVDCVAWDPRPIFGGKVVIQAKRYRNTVGVSAVRDLFGTPQNEGASKGIVVTTSGYGQASFDFAKNKPIDSSTDPTCFTSLPNTPASRRRSSRRRLARPHCRYARPRHVNGGCASPEALTGESARGRCRSGTYSCSCIRGANHICDLSSAMQTIHRKTLIHSMRTSQHGAYDLHAADSHGNLGGPF